MRKGNYIQFMARTAVLLAITLVFQMLRFVFPNTDVLTYVISTLVNLSLIVAAGVVGLPGGCVIAVLAPVMAFFQGHQQAPMMLPIMLGNASVVVAAFYAFKHKRLWIMGGGAIVKYIVIALGMALFMLGGLSTAAVIAAAGKQFVQLITAVMGAVIAVPVLAAVRKVTD